MMLKNIKTRLKVLFLVNIKHSKREPNSVNRPVAHFYSGFSNVEELYPVTTADMKVMQLSLHLENKSRARDHAGRK